jgi:hypothetical protein
VVAFSSLTHRLIYVGLQQLLIRLNVLQGNQSGNHPMLPGEHVLDPDIRIAGMINLAQHTEKGCTIKRSENAVCAILMQDRFQFIEWCIASLRDVHLFLSMVMMLDVALRRMFTIIHLIAVTGIIIIVFIAASIFPLTITALML